MMGTIINTKVKHLYEIKNEIFDDLILEETYDFSKYTGKIFGDLSKKGYKFNLGVNPKGRLTDIRLKMVFRKNK